MGTITFLKTAWGKIGNRSWLGAVLPDFVCPPSALFFPPLICVYILRFQFWVALKAQKGRAGWLSRPSKARGKLAQQGCISPRPDKFSCKTPSSSASAAAHEQRCLSRPACGIRIPKCTPAPRDFTDLLSVKGNNH